MYVINGQRLKELRGTESIHSIAKEIGVDRAVLWRLEHGATKAPRAETVKKIANFYGVSAESLYTMQNTQAA